MAKYLEGKGPITVNFLTTFEGNLRITFYHIYAGKVLRKGFRETGISFTDDVKSTTNAPRFPFAFKSPLK